MLSPRFAVPIRRVPTLMLLTALAGCGDATFLPSPLEQVVVVLNQGDASLTLVPIGDTNIRTIALGGGSGATTLAVRGERAVVPMGSEDVVKVVNLRTRTVEHTVTLPAGSGATGAAFLNDSVAVVANPGRNSVTPVDLIRGVAGAEIAVGSHPRAVVADANRAYVVNETVDAANAPAGPGTVTALSSATLAVEGTAQLTGLNPVAAGLRGGRLYVLNAGTPGGGNSSLSVLNAATLQEIRRIDGMGNLPGGIATMSGLPVFISLWSTGVVVYDPDSNTLVHGPSSPFVPGDRLPVSGLRLDENGLLYSMHPGDCTSPGVLVQMGNGGSLLAQADVGVCPRALGFATLPS